MYNNPQSVREARMRVDRSKEFYAKQWYHSFNLPDGTAIHGVMSVSHQLERYKRFPIPEDLAGRRVLDIGAWDGWFSFEAERHGASVTAIDCVSIPNLLHIRKQLASKVEYHVFDVYDLPRSNLGRFDIVFFLGVLYHLKHPLLALEILCSLTRDVAIVESFVTDGDNWEEHVDEIPTMEFYETNELGNGLDNWNGPTVSCLMALCRAAGFARVELMHAAGNLAGVACYRRWEPVLQEARRQPPELIYVMNSRTSGINFSMHKDEYISCGFRTEGEPVRRDELLFEVDGYGVPVMYVCDGQNGCAQANFRLPPGIDSGWRDVKLRYRDSAFGKALSIAVDIPIHVERLSVKAVYDGNTWNATLNAANTKFVSCWVAGLPANSDRTIIAAYIGTTPLKIDYVGESDPEGYRQINAAMDANIAAGTHPFVIECAGVVSAPWQLSVL